MGKDAYYFSHDSNAHTDPRILKLRMALGWEGYGIYWAIIENLRNQSGYYLSEDDFNFLTLSLAIDEAKLKQMLSKCLEVNLLALEGGKIFSESLLRRMSKADAIREKRREAGAKGGKAKANAKQVLKPSSSKPLALKESKGKETKVNKNIEERKNEFKESVLSKWNDLGGENYLSEDQAGQFFRYWSEHGDNDIKMRYEKEKSFGIGRRLGTWKGNNFNKPQGVKNQ